MIGPDFELQEAVVAALKASVDLQSLLGNPIRLYENVPSKPVFPYVTIGESQAIPDEAECIDGTEVIMTLHIWSRSAAGFGEAKKISATMWSVLSSAGIETLSENRVVIFDRAPLGDLSIRDPDGVTKHIVSQYRGLCEPL